MLIKQKETLTSIALLHLNANIHTHTYMRACVKCTNANIAKNVSIAVSLATQCHRNSKSS